MTKQYEYPDMDSSFPGILEVVFDIDGGQLLLPGRAPLNLEDSRQAEDGITWLLDDLADNAIDAIKEIHAKTTEQIDRADDLAKQLLTLRLDMREKVTALASALTNVKLSEKARLLVGELYALTTEPKDTP